MCTDRHGEIKQFMQLLERRPEKKFGINALTNQWMNEQTEGWVDKWIN